jgi:hypothetical protein
MLWIGLMMGKSVSDEGQRLAKLQAEQERFMQSGLSVERWCQQEGIAKSAFYMRRSRLKLNHAKLKMARIEPTVKRSKAFSVRPAFIDAGVFDTKQQAVKTPTISPNNQTSAEVRIDLGGGVIITVSRTGASSLANAQ